MSRGRPRKVQKAIRPDISLEDIWKYPGLHELGSDLDQAMKALRENVGRRRAQVIDGLGLFSVRQSSGELGDHGIVPKWTLMLGTFDANSPAAATSREQAWDNFDAPFLIEFDKRLRWCRLILDKVGMPYDKGEAVCFASSDPSDWCYASEPRASDMDRRSDDPLRHAYDHCRPHTIPWYAVRCLIHARRGVDLLYRTASPEQPLTMRETFGLLRELVLFGEASAEAEFLIRAGKKAVVGAKVKKGGQDAHAATHGTDEAKERRAAMGAEARALIDHGCPKMAAYSRVAKKYGVSLKTVQRNLDP